MACYNHVEKTELCTCAYCGKHLCQDCHKKTGNCMVCKNGECADKLKEMQHCHEGAHCHHMVGGRVCFLSKIIDFLAGIFLLWISYHSYIAADVRVAIVAFIVGLLMVGGSLFCFYRRHKMKKTQE